MFSHDSGKNQKCVHDARSNCKMNCDLFTHMEIYSRTSSRHIGLKYFRNE